MTDRPTPERMTNERLAEIEKRCEAAGKGPWEVSACSNGLELVTEDGDVFATFYGDDYDPQCWPVSSNTAFAIGARQDIPDLLAAIRAEREECERLRDTIRRARLFMDTFETMGRPSNDTTAAFVALRERLAADALKGEK